MTGEDHTDVDQVLGPGGGQRVGSFRFYFREGRWEWSDAVALMHGYEPGTVVPTTELLLSHKHPDDRPQVAAILDAVRRGEPFSSRHRIIDTGGRVHMVVVVGGRLPDGEGNAVGTAGFYVDVTESVDAQVRASVDGALAELSQSRAVIEQAKGMLMLVYGISAERAFDVLAWRSQETNIKLRALAAQLVAAAGTGAPKAFRDKFDQLLLTAHERR